VRASAAARREVLAAYVDLNAAHMDLLRVLTQDPSAARRPASATHAALEGRMLQLLAGREDPDLTDQIRARAALAAIRGAFVHAHPEGDPAVVRAAILAAACGALGIPAPHPGPR
jgi:hypothetical protein